MVRGAKFSGVVGGGFPEELYVRGLRNEWESADGYKQGLCGWREDITAERTEVSEAWQGLVGNCKYTSAFRVEHAQEWSRAWTSLVVQWLRFYTPKAVECGLVSDQGTRFHMLQLRVCMPELKILHVTTMTWCSQIIKYINIFFFFLRMEQSRLRAWNGFIWPWAHRCGDTILLGQFLGSHGRCGGYPGGCG